MNEPLNQQKTELREAIRTKIYYGLSMAEADAYTDEIMQLHQAALTAFADGVESLIGEDDDESLETWGRSLARELRRANNTMRKEQRHALAQLRKEAGI